MFRGTYPARIDEKSRLKIPKDFRTLIEQHHGREVFVTSTDGTHVRIYPMPVWLDIEDDAFVFVRYAGNLLLAPVAITVNLLASIPGAVAVPGHLHGRCGRAAARRRVGGARPGGRPQSGGAGLAVHAMTIPLQCRSVRRAFRGWFGGPPIVAIADATFELAAGEIACLVGAAGAGKTTLLRLGAGLLRPDAGVVHVAGVPPYGPHGPVVRRLAGFAPRDPVFPPAFTVREVLEYCARRHTAGRDARTLARDATELAGLEAFVSCRAATLGLAAAHNWVGHIQETKDRGRGRPAHCRKYVDRLAEGFGPGRRRRERSEGH